VKRPSLNFLLRWGVILATLIFVGKAFYDNWQKVSTLDIGPQGWIFALAALGIALVSHVWQGILWGWILKDLGKRVPWRWSLGIFLILEIAKYLPGDIWHLLGRIRIAQKDAKIPVEIGTTSVLLEPILITAAGMGLALLCTPHPYIQGLGGFSLVCILIGVHPPIFERVLNWLGNIKKSPWVQRMLSWFKRDRERRPRPVRLRQYPLGAVIAAFLSMGLRCISFLMVLAIFTSLGDKPLLPIIGGFGFAWMLGLALPGLPGGVGVFEATAIALLRGTLPTGLLLGGIGVYRLVSTLTEILGVGLGWLIKGKQQVALKQLLGNRGH
jgi:glycosyltransferase 2 family protein